MRPPLAILAALAVVAVPSAAFAEGSFTTRIEPRAYYGATVTIEQGVRVWRPLPPVRHMIINPGNGTPLSLGYTDVRETRTTNVYRYDADRGDRGYGYGGGVGFPDGTRGHVKRQGQGGLGPRQPRN